KRTKLTVLSHSRIFCATTTATKMLRHLHIENYTLIDSLDMEFRPGFNLLSGETGSGKSIVVDAVALLLGGKASAELIRSGAERAQISGVFCAQPPAASKAGSAQRPSSQDVQWA